MPAIRYASAHDGVRIAWTRIPGDSPPFLMVRPPGSQGMAALFTNLSPASASLRELRQQRSAVVFDWRGSGLSDPPTEPISINDLVSDLESVLEAIGEPIDACVSLHACFPACLLAGNRPGLFRSMLFTRPAISMSQLSATDAGLVEFVPQNVEAYRTLLFYILNSYSEQPSEATNRAVDAWIRNVPLEVRAQYIEACRDVDLSAVLPRVAVPVAVAASTSREVEQQFTSLLPHVRMEPQLSSPPVSVMSGRDLRAIFDRLLPESTGEPSAGGTHPLSPREAEVVRLVARGLSNQQIALDLGIAPTTVITHVRHIFEKLNCASRAEAAAWAVRNGLG